MRKGKSVIGQPVFSIAEGRRLETVKDLVLEEGEDGVVALLVSEGGLLNTSTVIPFASVQRFGLSAVMVDAGASVVPATSDARVNEILGRQGTLLGSRVVTVAGEELGSIADLYFDETSGRVIGYEVSSGLLNDSVGGPAYLPFERIRTVGPDVVVATDEPAAGVDGSVGAPDQEMSLAVTSGSSQDGPGLIGSRARRDVLDRTGAVVAAGGQIVTTETMERARTAGVSDELYDATGVRRPGVKEPDPGEAISRAAESAADLWTRFTSKMSEMTDAAGQRLDAQATRTRLEAINDAIGRPVTKVFLDRDDTVILDLGDLVTHQAIQRAADAGLLDSLLASVYRGGDITFTRDEMRAGVGGDSTVEHASGGASVVDELTAKVEASRSPDEVSPESAEARSGETGDGRRAGDEERRAGRSPGQTVGQRHDADLVSRGATTQPPRDSPGSDS